MQKKGESQRPSSLPPLGPGAGGVCGFGENSVDVLAEVSRFPIANEKAELRGLSRMVGGQVASALVACARLGQPARYLGTFGDDENGRLVRATLEREGVDVSACLVAGVPNRSALIVVDEESATRTVLWRRDSGLDWPVGQLPADIGEIVEQARVVLVDVTDADAATAVAGRARLAGVPVVADVDGVVTGLAGLLPLVDVLIASEGVLELLAGTASRSAAMRWVSETYGTALVVVTLGAAGAVAWDGGRERMVHGCVVPVRDTTGAGDAFRGGFLARWLALDQQGLECELQEVLEWANATAALNCRAVGAQDGLPTAVEVEALVTATVSGRSKGMRSVLPGSLP